MFKNKINTIIVTYNPEINRLQKVILQASLQTQKVIVIDNNSQNFYKVKRTVNGLLPTRKNIKIIGLNRNLGLAGALNKGIKYITQKKFRINFILTLDQDTILKKDAIKTISNEYKKLPANIKNKVGIIHMNYEKPGKRLIDRFIFNETKLQKNKLYLFNRYQSFFPVKYVIQSGMLIKKSVAARFKFKAPLFIDQVDREYCTKIIKAENIILESNKILLHHNLGIFKKYNGKTIHYENANRLYYFTRNSTYLLKEKELPYLEYFFGITMFYRKYVIANGFHTIPKLVKIFIIGIHDGCVGKLGKTELDFI
ncbi:MAG: hypothetical protein JJ59_00155 [Candidatus Micrarchaeum sp. AZ1]|jgi:rhamnosyltransferase|nr:MAG: hypothetical protein JJ59_00155 [Candidatus Micrarchaeum sp. AZ1]